MGKLSEDYKKKYLLLEIENKELKAILQDALKDYIAKKAKEIESYSKSEAHVRATDIEHIAKVISTCMKWRDNIEIMGSDMGPRDFQFYENGIERII
jgi:hypothetical protein